MEAKLAMDTTSLLLPNYVFVLIRIGFFAAVLRIVWILLAQGEPDLVPGKKGRMFATKVSIFFWLLTLCFGAALAYQASWQLLGITRPEFVEFMQKYDRRPFNPAHHIQRGKILDREGRMIAGPQSTETGNRRHYPFGKGFSHIIGYRHPVFGMSGIEKTANRVLSGSRLETLTDWRHLSRNVVTQEKLPRGQDIQLTLSAQLQNKAFELLRGKTGAVVVMDAKDGGLLTVASAPAFDPNHLSQEQFDEDSQAPLLNRALAGLYPPGSTFKIAMAAFALEMGLPDTIDCPADGFRVTPTTPPIRDHLYYEKKRKGLRWRGYGRIDLATALSESSNVYFAKLGATAGAPSFGWIEGRMGFGRSHVIYDTADNPLKSIPGQLPALDRPAPFEYAQAAIGQGKLLVTPLQMAILVAAIANQGVAMQPRLRLKAPAAVLGPFMSSTTASKLGVMLRRVVTHGTAKRLGTYSIAIAGKTGTAENPHGNPHSWFVAYAPFENPKIAVSVIVENGGYGSQVALSMTRDLIGEAAELKLLEPLEPSLTSPPGPRTLVQSRPLNP